MDGQVADRPSPRLQIRRVRHSSYLLHQRVRAAMLCVVRHRAIRPRRGRGEDRRDGPGGPGDRGHGRRPRHRGRDHRGAFVEDGYRAVSIDLGDPEEPRERTRYLAGAMSDRRPRSRRRSRISTRTRAAWMSSSTTRASSAWASPTVSTRRSGDQVVDVAPVRHVPLHPRGASSGCSLAGRAPSSPSRRPTAFVGMPGRGPYTAAKGAISALTRTHGHRVRRGRHPRQRGRARVDPRPSSSSRASATGRSCSSNLLSEIPMRRQGECRRDRQGHPLPRRPRFVLHHGPDDRGRRWLDDPGHARPARLARPHPRSGRLKG